MRITTKARTWLLAALVALTIATSAAQVAKASPTLMLGTEEQHHVAFNFTKITYETRGWA